MGDGTVGSAKVSEHGGNGNASKAKGVIIKSSEVEAINGAEKLFLEFLTDGGGKGEFGDLHFEDMDEFADNKLGCARGNDRCITGMSGKLEGNASRGKVISIGHDKAKVTMAAACSSGGDSMSIGIDFLGEEFDGSVGGCPSDWGQIRVWESNGRRC